MQFSVLGGVRAWRAGTEVDLGARQPRLMAAMLLARAGHPVAVSELVELLWGDDPPPTAVNVVHRHIGAIRRVIEPGLARRAEGEWLVRRPGGYRITAPTGAVDLLLFRAKAAHAAAELQAGRTEPAIAAYREALALWHGRFGAGLDADTHPLFVAVNRERSMVAYAAAAAAPDGPGAVSLLPAVQEAAAAEPFDEALQARLLLLLASAGRPAEAIERYHHLRERLVSDLGLSPGRELTAAFETILREPPAPVPGVAPGRPAVPVSAPGGWTSVPAQLPPASPLFTGRRAERAELGRMLGEGIAQQHGAAVVAVDGMLGVGKTALAVHWAYEIAERFPDGQLFLNLRGSGRDEPSTAAESLGRLLCGLGVPCAELPRTAQARAAQWRTLTSGRRLLILLDDAREAEQVRPLIPAAPGSVVLVTSRSRLTGLAAADGALLLTLDVPPAEDARHLLLRRLNGPAPAGPEDEDMLATLLSRSGRLPLAMAIVAARISEHRPRPLRELASCLPTLPGLDPFIGDDADADLRAVFERSYHGLGRDAARMLRSLSRGGSPAVDPDVAAELAGVARTGASAALSEIYRAGLLVRTGLHRYTVIEPVLEFARELAEQTAPRHTLRLVPGADRVRYAGMAAG
ncbi:BTAD domain-containing putative transcriptional regulator [Actinoplanes sp. NPDC051851]|uniref:AfsR/SARP family transcriptional regulator n=1 Tax=Actinoplanes sp. NPDC051851 TaxID=3154753 RepID=UPI00341F5A6D